MQNSWVFETTYVTSTSPFAIPADVSCILSSKKVYDKFMTFKFMTFIQCLVSITEKPDSVRSLTVFFDFWCSSDSGSKTASGF